LLSGAGLAEAMTALPFSAVLPLPIGGASLVRKPCNYVILARPNPFEGWSLLV
jgi:hypothetical protein